MNVSRKLISLLTTVTLLVSFTSVAVRADAIIDPGLPDPYPARMYFQIGLYFQWHGNNERAISEFSAAIDEEPAMAEAFRARANSFVALMQYENAIADYSQALRLNTNPENSTIFRERGLTFAALGNFEAAQRDLNNWEKARHDPDFRFGG